MEKELKERNGCISFWLWIAIVANIGMSIFYAVTMFSSYSKEMALGLGICSILGAVNVLSAILLLRWNKIGFYMMMASSIMTIVVNLCVLKTEPIAAIGSLIAILIWWAILQMKKKGVSAWSQLRSGWDVKHCRHLYQLFAGVGGVLFLLTLIAFGQEHSNPFKDIMVKDDTDIEAVVDTVSVDSVEIDTIAVVEEETEVPVVSKRENRAKRETNKPNPSKQVSTNDDDVAEKSLRFLKQAIAEGNKQFPQQAAEGMIMKKIYLDGDYVMYLAECDEDLYDIDLLELNKSEMKKNIKQMAGSNEDPMISYFVKLCVKARMGLGFKYQGTTSNKSCIVRITYSELKEL